MTSVREVFNDYGSLTDFYESRRMHSKYIPESNDGMLFIELNSVCNLLC